MPASTKRAGSVDPITPDGLADTELDQATRLIECERSQIAHEIHDSLLPLIFAASATVSSILARSNASDADPAGDSSEDEAAAGSVDHAHADETIQKLQHVAGWLGDAMQAGRRLLTQVYPPELIGTLWVKAAKDSIGRLFADDDVRIQWQVDPAVNETSTDIAVAAYRITVEAIRNAVGRGHASEVVVEAEQQSDAFEVRIRDNGDGFDPSQVPPDRFGIRSMIGRAAMVGGRVHIDSQPGGPTTVTFRSTGGE